MKGVVRLTRKPDVDIEVEIFHGSVTLAINALSEDGVSTFRLLIPSTDAGRKLAADIIARCDEVDGEEK